LRTTVKNSSQIFSPAIDKFSESSFVSVFENIFKLLFGFTFSITNENVEILYFIATKLERELNVFVHQKSSKILLRFDSIDLKSGEETKNQKTQF
jgi:hypothetical protein